MKSSITTKNDSIQNNLSKVPELTLIFWIIKIAATTLGETGGDAVSMSMNLGYLVGTAIFASIFLIAVVIQFKAPRFHPVILGNNHCDNYGWYDTGGLCRSVSWNWLCWRIIVTFGITHWLTVHLAPNTRVYFSEFGQ
jgi:hypothetical protein